MSPRRLLSAALPGVLLPLALAACAGAGAYPAMPAPESLPANSPLLSQSLGRTDAWLRRYVMEGKPDSAVGMLDPASRVRPRDELVRQLQLGLVYHYAGKWEASNAAFEWAETEAAQRWTKSLTGQVGELVLNDAAAGYVPPPGEMALIPYYRMLNYLALGASDGALVEARKASDWLGRLSEEKDPCVGDGFVHYLAGLAFRGAGERNDALVSYRNAERSFAVCAEKDDAGAPEWLGAELYRAARDAGVGSVADSAAARYRLAHLAMQPDPASAELVVFVENGWVAHRASADVHVPIFPEEVDGVDGGDAGQVAAAATRVIAHLVGNLQEQSFWGEALDDRPEFQLAAAADGAYVMKLAWPEYRLEASDAPAVRVVVDSQAVDAPMVEDLSAVMLRRWQAQRPAVLSRMVGRGIVKFLASHALERHARKKGGEAAGWITGRLANLAGNALEHADTRGWTLLPNRISVARFTLPAGEHTVRLEVLDGGGAVTQTVELGHVTLHPRGTLVLNRRVWGEEMGDVRTLYRRGGGVKTAERD
jgi:tetratricopeptide (TPR) repeat protein